MNELENYHGRLFTKYQLTSEEREKAKTISSVVGKNSCFRCGTSFEEENKLEEYALFQFYKSVI